MKEMMVSSDIFLPDELDHRKKNTVFVEMLLDVVTHRRYMQWEPLKKLRWLFGVNGK